MKKITPSVTALTLAGLLVSCGTSTPPVAPTAPVAPKAQQTDTQVPVTPTPAPTPTPAVTSSGEVSNVVNPVTDATSNPAATTPLPTDASGAAPAAGGPADATSLNSTKIVTKVVGYDSPAGKEEIEVTLSISNNTITSVFVKPLATHDISKKLQTGFADAIQIAVGKPTAAFTLDVVSGASLTTKAFNAYVQSL